jgi:hypothetical protein
MKLKVLLLVFLSLCLCFSGARKLKSRRTSGGPPLRCTTLIPADPMTENSLLSSGGFIFCSHITDKHTIDTTDLEPTSPPNIYLLSYKDLPHIIFDANAEIGYDNVTNMWTLKSGEVIHQFKVVDGGLFYRIAYDFVFYKNYLKLSKTELTEEQRVSLEENFKRNSQTLFSLKVLIDYVIQNDIIGWKRLVYLVNSLFKLPEPETIELDLKLLLNALDLDNKDLNGLEILARVIKSDKKLYKLSEFVDENPAVPQYFQNTKILQNCLALAENQNQITFLNFLRNFKYEDIDFGLNYLKENNFATADKFKKFIASYSKSSNRSSQFAKNGSSAIRFFNIFKNLLKKRNFGVTSDHILEEEFLKEKNMLIIQNFVEFTECLGNNLKNIIDHVKTDEFKLLWAFFIEQNITKDDFNNLDRFESIEKYDIAWSKLKNNFISGDESTSFIINSDTKDIILSLFNGLSSSKIIPFLEGIISKQENLKNFKPAENNDNAKVKAVSEINGLLGFVKPFIVTFRVNLPDIEVVDNLIQFKEIFLMNSLNMLTNLVS